MDASFQQIKTNFRTLLVAAVDEGLEHVAQVMSDSRWIGTYFQWPVMSKWESGLPSFRLSQFEGPKDYSMLFTGPDPIIDADTLKSFQALVSYVKQEPFLQDRLLPVTVGQDRQGVIEDERLVRIFVYQILEALIDRYIHTHARTTFDMTAFEVVYEPYARYLFEEQLLADIYVPILFLKFADDTITIDENTAIERMSDAFQLARAPLKAYGPGVHEAVMGAATHALVLRNWPVRNGNTWEFLQRLTEVSVYPLDDIDNFFAAVRIVTGFETGYAQLLVNPKGWAAHYKADLPPIEGTSRRAYPNRFENFYWLRKEVPEINKAGAQEIGRVFLKLLQIKGNSVQIAARRLNLCYLREHEEDYILDATIALEALFSDDERTEMTHKLALRVAALATISDVFRRPPKQVFREVKQIYGYRSAVVHGSKKTDRARDITVHHTQRVPAGTLAVEYLRHALLILIDHPQYREPSRIDEDLLLGKGVDEQST